MLSDQDVEELVKQECDVNIVEHQLQQFIEGFPFLKLQHAATIGKGILRINDEDKEKFLSAYDSWSGKRVKFVPASGAATRMFKSLYEAQDALQKGNALEEVLEANKDVELVFENLDKFAFNSDINEYEGTLQGVALNSSEWYLAIISYILNKPGLNYGSLPKGLIKFHKYAEGCRTAAAEHLVEGIMYAKNYDSSVNIHFTVSPQHLELFEAEVAHAANSLNIDGLHFNVEYSIQKKSTDTIAVDLDNKPFRDADGNLVFRPAGHGALLENLNDIDADIIFIKNIDNVVPDSLKSTTVEYKKLLAGVLINIQQQAFSLLRQLDSEGVTDSVKESLAAFCAKVGVDLPTSITDSSIRFLLDRPIRICGMVKNQGEPGGGPFIALNGLGQPSLQIVESSQVDLANAEQKLIFSEATHFNPVDLVCGVKNYQGEKFDLLRFRDEKTGFISIKSKDGRDLKAMELPGLWNGAMSNWITLFVEVPLITFNPVKTINDLLRFEHQ